jgi:hypothetical protein
LETVAGEGVEFFFQMRRNAEKWNLPCSETFRRRGWSFSFLGGRLIRRRGRYVAALDGSSLMSAIKDRRIRRQCLVRKVVAYQVEDGPAAAAIG